MLNKLLLAILCIAFIAGCSVTPATNQKLVVDYNRNAITGLIVKSRITYNRGEQYYSHHAPYLSDHSERFKKGFEPSGDALYLTVTAPEYNYKKVILVAGSEAVKLNLLPPFDDIFIPPHNNGKKYTDKYKEYNDFFLPYALLLEGIKLKPNKELSVNIKAEFYAGVFVEEDEPVKRAFNHLPTDTKLTFTEKQLDQIVVPHWPINHYIKKVENGESVKLANIVKKWRKNKRNSLLSFYNETYGTGALKANQCFPAIKIGHKGALIPTVTRNFRYLTPKAYQVNGDDLLHYLASTGKNLAGFIQATYLMGMCTDFFVTDKQGNTFLHNYVYKFKSLKNLKRYFKTYHWQPICEQVNEYGRNCFDRAVETGAKQITLDALQQGYRTAFYSKQQVSKTAKRGMSKHKYDNMLKRFAPRQSECEQLNKAYNKVSEFTCAYRDQYHVWQSSPQCESNQERVKNVLKKHKNSVCKSLATDIEKIRPSFGQYEKINFSHDIKQSRYRRGFDKQDFENKYPMAFINLRSMLNDTKLAVRKEQKAQAARNNAMFVENLKANEQSRQAIKQLLNNTYKVTTDLANSQSQVVQTKAPKVTAKTGSKVPNSSNKTCEVIPLENSVSITWQNNPKSCGELNKNTDEKNLRFIPIATVEFKAKDPSCKLNVTTKIPTDNKVSAKCKALGGWKEETPYSSGSANSEGSFWRSYSCICPN